MGLRGSVWRFSPSRHHTPAHRKVRSMKASRIGKKYGWRPELPSMRRESVRFGSAYTHLPSFVDLRLKFPPCYDQLNLGSCTANALAACVEFDLIKQKLPRFIPSRLFVYYNERQLEGTTSSDAGARISDGVKAISVLGAPPEIDWPYIPDSFATKPSVQAYVDAKRTRALNSQVIDQNLDDMRACLAGGFPFVFGFSVYESFESDAVAANGVVPMPEQGEQVVGGHAVVCVGYSDQNVLSGVPAQHFVVRNSWGTEWGTGGYCFMPYAYLTRGTLASDFYRISSVS